ncbi:hypothetical protein EV359DRAFT_65077 [Lentinula novae-zelandiae]|nr:hypothetical protein EV359DRAFT_65077 [Lentinula novae-zelandiae]
MDGEPYMASRFAASLRRQMSKGQIYLALFFLSPTMEALGMYHDENPTSTLFDVWWPYIIQGSRFGEYDQLWSSNVNISSADKRLFPPAAMVAAQTMFAGRVNDTRYPGLQGRLAKASPQNGSQEFIFENTTTEDGAWINFTMPAPPYWDPVIPGLNFTAYWGSSDSFNGLPTQVFFQPWVFPASSTNIGHHQVIMVIATQRNQSLLTDVNNSLGNLLNFTTSPDETSCFEDLCHAYIQAIGCTLTSQNLKATIYTQSRLLDPHTDIMQLEGPELPHDDHAWDEFSWEDSTNLAGIDRQFLLAFSPTSFYNNTLTSDESDISIPLPILSKMLDGDLFSPFAGTSNPTSNANSLVEFQGSLERLYASYLWNINRLYSLFDSLQPYWEYCGQYWDEPYSSADLGLELPLSTALTIVFWRAIVSVACSVIMLLLGFAILGTAGDRERNIPPQGQGFLNTARLLKGSTIPELVTVKAQTVKTSRNPEPEILEAVLTHRLRHHSKDGSAGEEILSALGNKNDGGIGIEIPQVYDILHEASAYQQQEFIGNCLRGVCLEGMMSRANGKNGIVWDTWNTSLHRDLVHPP